MPETKKKYKDMTPDERREQDRVRKQKSRSKQKFDKVANATPAEQRVVLEETWRRNLESLSAADRAELEVRIEEWDRINNLMINSCRAFRDHVVYGENEHLPDLAFREIESFAKKYPPQDGVGFHELLEKDPALIRDIDTAPESFQRFGEPIDHVDHVLYFDFLHLFQIWYREFRNAGVVEDLWDAEDSWDVVDQLFRDNPRLRPSVGKSPAPKQPEWQLRGFGSQREFEGHLLDLKRTQRNIDLQQAAQKLDLMTPDERRKAELLEQVRREW